jgi:hypothetical protein
VDHQRGACCSRNAFAPFPSALKQELHPGYAPTYYPNTTDSAKAQAISVGPGDEIRSVDLFLRPSKLVSVSGRVINAVPSISATSGTISLQPRSSGLAEVGQDLRDSFKLKDGSFIIHNVPPGSYFLVATWWERESREWHVTRRRLDVGNSDIEGVTLTISRGAPVNIFVGLQPLVEDEFGVPGQMLKPDGTFQFKNVPEGAYCPIVRVHTPEEKGFFLRSARYGTETVGDAGIVVQAGAEISLELNISSHAAHLNGVIVNSDSLPAVGVTVVLVPDPPRRDMKYRYESATTDQNGKFTMTGITLRRLQAFQLGFIRRIRRTVRWGLV